MANILAIETSTTACSAALMAEGEVQAKFSVEVRSHSKLLLSMIDELLDGSPIQAKQLNCIAVTTGPGSFTGLRIGFGVVQGLAVALDCPVVDVSALQALAATALREQELQAGTRLFTVMDARMGEFNCALYSCDANGQWQSELEDCLLTEKAVRSEIERLSPDMIVGDASVLQGNSVLPVARCVDMYPNALDVLSLAVPRYQAGEARSINDIELRYLRGTEAWRKHQRIRTKN